MAMALMNMNGQEGHIQSWDMEALSEVDVMSIETDGNCTTPRYRGVLVGGHPNKAIN